MAADGIAYGNRVSHFNTPKALATVVDAILNSTTLASRLMYNGKNFNRSTLKKDVKVTRRSQGQYITGLETLNSAAEDVTIQMEFNRTLYTMPTVKILAEAFARQYDQDVDYDAFEYGDALDETLNDLSTAIYGYGTGNQPLGLGAIVDDGTEVATIGGQSRSTYSMLAATDTDWAGKMSLSKLATMHDAISDTAATESPTVIVSPSAVFSYFESLLTPTVTHERMVLPIGGRYPKAVSRDIGAGQGFSMLDFRGIPFIKDKACGAGHLYMLNENYLDWYGDAKVPAEFSKFLSKISLGKNVKEGQATDRPSDYSGFFYREETMMPDQLGTVGRFVVSGQLVSFQPRRHGKAYNVNGV